MDARDPEIVGEIDLFLDTRQSPQRVVSEQLHYVLWALVALDHLAKRSSVRKCQGSSVVSLLHTVYCVAPDEAPQ